MTDRIVFQKIGVPIPPTQKVARLKREDQDSEKRRFEEELNEEKDEKKNDDTVSLESKSQNTNDGERGQDMGSPKKNMGAARRPKRKKVRDNNVPGSLVDIRV